MSRTHRRGQRSRNLRKYLKKGIIWPENKGFHSQKTREFVPYWYDNNFPDRTYWEYVEAEVRKHHQEKARTGTPRWIRKVDVANQTRSHKLAISQAMKSRDYDVVLVGLDQMFLMCRMD